MSCDVDEFYGHPITEGVVAVGVDSGYAVLGDGVLVASESGYDVSPAVEYRSGRVVAWGDEWISYDSEWQNLETYQVTRLWIDVMQWLTPQKRCQVSVPGSLLL